MLRSAVSFGLLCLLALVAAGSTPKAGDPAPQFSLPDAAGKQVSLKDYADKSKLVLVFYRGYW
jgi:peroxiredoxin